MIIKSNKIVETNSLFPSTDWYNEGNIVLDETKEENRELILKIMENAPYMDLIIEDSKLIDIIPRPDLSPEFESEFPQLPTQEERIEALELAMLEMILGGIE